MKLKVFENSGFLILLTLLFSVSSFAGHLGVDNASRQVLESSHTETLYTSKGVLAESIFVIDRFSQEQRFAAPMGVFYDKHRDEIYVADTGNDQVDIFDANGQPLFQIRSDQGLDAPLDVVVTRENQIYISQKGVSHLQLFDFRGRHLAAFQGPDSSPFKPGRMCLDAEGNLYVADRERAKILVYDSQGYIRFQFGGKGEGEGEFRLISGIAVDSSGRIYVADSKQRPIQVFDRNGQFLMTFGSHGHRNEEFSFPGGICVDEKDRLWVVDTFSHKVKIFGADGSFLSQFGSFGTKAGQLFFPVDLALDGHGRAYILEKGANRLQVFDVKDQ